MSRCSFGRIQRRRLEISVVPDDTWAIAIDDSRIQRKIVTRILLNAGGGPGSLYIGQGSV
jgi:hypothetical protein